MQGIAKNNPIEKQINVEIQATLKHVTAVKLTEEKNWSLQIARIDFNYKSELLVSEYVFFRIIFTAWRVPKYGVFSGPHFPAFGLNTERYTFPAFGLNTSLRIQSVCGEIRTKKNSIFGYFSRSASLISKLFNFEHASVFWVRPSSLIFFVKHRITIQKQPSRGALKVLIQICALQLYWNCISAWVFSCKFPGYFQNTFY